MLRRTALICASALTLVAAPHALAATKKPAARVVKAPIVAVIDTGVNATHQEFDYRGKASTVDQFVGWWDFTDEAKKTSVLPAAGQTWTPPWRTPTTRTATAR